MGKAKPKPKPPAKTKPGANGPDTVLDIAAIKPLANNARHHNEHNRDLIRQSIDELGPARSGVIDETNTLLAGHGTLEALKKAGIKTIRVVDGSENEWVVVRRTGLTKDQKIRLSLYDNRTSELATWDNEALAKLAEANEEILTQLWTGEEIQSFIAGLTPPDNEDPGPQDGKNSFVIKIEGVAPKHKDKLLRHINTYLETQGYPYSCEAF